MSNDRIIFDTTNYFIINIQGMPQVTDKDNKSLWFCYSALFGLVLKDNFDKYFWDCISHQFYGDEKYKAEITILKEQMEEYYGLYTMINVMQ